MVPHAIRATLLAGIATLQLVGCRTSDEAAAEQLCAEAQALDSTDSKRALLLQRRVWEEMPYTGTRAAKRCGRHVRERMGRARAKVAHDKRGSTEAVEGCEWVANAMEVFGDSVNPPYRQHWARRLAERCVRVIGRAWTRNPESANLAALNVRLIELSRQPSEDQAPASHPRGQ